MNMLQLQRALRQYLALPTIGQPPLTALLQPLTTNNPGGMEIDGALIAPSAVIQVANALQAFNAPWQSSLVSGASTTLTVAPNQITRFSNAGAITLTLDYAYNIVNAMQYPFNGQTFYFELATYGAGGSIATPTLSDTAVTLSATTALAATSFRKFIAQITQLYTTSGAALTAGTTFTSLTQVGTTNAFTVALGTNAISPTVGQVIFINTTAGTLPPGWYPIVKVTSATSFIIATPPGTVWTATAATLPGTTVVPTSQYTPGSPLVGAAGSVGVFSPLMTITGLFTATTTAV